MSDQMVSGPYVQLATFCDMAIEDKSGALCIIRLIDRYTVTGQTPEIQPTPINLTLAFSLKAGLMSQRARIQIKPNTPSGKELAAFEFNALFEGNERGVQGIFPVRMVLHEEGLYWFDLRVDEQLLTRIPLRLLYQRIVTGGSTRGSDQASPD